MKSPDGKVASAKGASKGLPDNVEKKGQEYDMTDTEGWKNLENVYGTSQEVIDTLDKKVNDALR